MHKIIEKIKKWEEDTYYYGDKLEVKPLIFSFATLFFIFFIITITLLAIFLERSISINLEDIFYIISGIAVLFFLSCLPGAVMALACGLIMERFRIRSPLKGIVSTLILSLVLFGIYSTYRMYWPIGSEEVLLEDFKSKSQNCIIKIVHRDRCEFFRGYFQEKKSFQEYIKKNNYMYCRCVNPYDIKLLDAYSRKNCIYEECDDTERGYGVYYGYDLSKGGFKEVSSKDIMEEYYSK